MVSCWVVTDGKAGMENQCVGFAQALGIVPVVKRIVLRPFWRKVTPYLRFGGGRQFAAGSDALAPPWPDLVIATGRQSVAASLWVKRASGGKARIIQLQNPGIAWRRFDLIVAPEHDRLRGTNVISSRGALHGVQPALLAGHARRWGREFAHLRRPYIVVLLGGSNSAYRFAESEAKRLAAKLAACAGALNGSLLVTPSRRTGDAAQETMREALTGVPHFFWDMQGDNPYLGLLGLADFLVVTCDSVNMISEAASTGKPVYVEILPGGSAKSARFLRSLRDAGVVRDFSGTLCNYSYAPLDEMTRLVARVRQALPEILA